MPPTGCEMHRVEIRQTTPGQCYEIDLLQSKMNIVITTLWGYSVTVYGR